jgi:cytochrome c oxidase accessory protein FixG
MAVSSIDADDADIPDQPLYAVAKKIYPQSVKGTFRQIKWVLLVVTLGLYYLLPFVRWDRGPNAPSQAVLIDFPHRRFYFFFIEIWPQEVYYLTGLLILAAMALFLMNALAGRVWCGYLCPQTVWTDLFLAVERLIEGDRRERMARDAGPWTLEKITDKVLKHAAWLIIAWWTGGAWVLYFADAPTLVRQLATFQAPLTAYVWIAILTCTTYVLAGYMREQVCLYMCPWPRIQAALTDDEALNVTYRYDRGEPRTSVKKALALRAKGDRAGDCIDCGQCVVVCPTGVDIRQGPSLGCIQCGLCIDACDAIMHKVGRQPRLIAYDTDLNIKRRLEGKPNVFRPVRTRTLLYVAVIALVGSIMLYSLLTRAGEGIAVMHDRNPMFVRLSSGALRNAFTVRLINKQSDMRQFQLRVDGLAGATLELADTGEAGEALAIAVGPDETREMRLLVTTASPLPPDASVPLSFEIVDLASGRHALTKDFFKGP